MSWSSGLVSPSKRRGVLHVHVGRVDRLLTAVTEELVVARGAKVGPVATDPEPSEGVGDRLEAVLAQTNAAIVRAAIASYQTFESSARRNHPSAA